MSCYDLLTILATCKQARSLGRETETVEQVHKRGLVDGAICGLLFMAGFRRVEVAALTRSCDREGSEESSLLVEVRVSNTNKERELNLRQG